LPPNASLNKDHGAGNANNQPARLAMWSAMKSAIDGGISPRSAHAFASHACASSTAISSLTSRDQPSAVLKATIRTGDEY